MCTCILNLVYFDRLSTLQFQFPPIGGSATCAIFYLSETGTVGYNSTWCCVCISSVFFLSFVGTADLTTDRPQSKDCQQTDVKRFRKLFENLKCRRYWRIHNIHLLTQLSIPTHAQLQRHRLKFIKNHLKAPTCFGLRPSSGSLQCPR